LVCTKGPFLLIALLAGLLPTLAPAEIRTVYVIPSSYWDRGFLTSPEELLPRLKPHLDEPWDWESSERRLATTCPCAVRFASVTA